MTPRPHKFAFYLDENFPEAAGKFFSKRGHRLHDGKRLLGYGHSDPDHLKEAARRNAMVVSFNKDFLVDQDLLDRIRHTPGVILIQSTKANLNDLSAIIARLLHRATPNQFAGKLCRISIDGVWYA